MGLLFGVSNSNVSTAFSVLKIQHDRFFNHLKEIGYTSKHSERFDLENNQITFQFQEFTFTAAPNVVRRSDSDGTAFILEYDFKLPWQSTEISIGRFYLNPNGITYSDSSFANQLFETNDDRVFQRIGDILLDNLLRTSILYLAADLRS